MRSLYRILFLLIVFSGCKKTELEVITPNKPPPDKTIDAVTVENYINRSYILALGREPDSSEFNDALDLLKSTSLDSASRQTFLNEIFNSPDYLVNVYNENRVDLLNNTDTSEFTSWITLFQFLLTDSTYQFQWPYLQYEIDRLLVLRNAFPEFTSGTIKIDELHRRMCNNYVYDQINMGSANFVIFTFQNLINRNPTMSEQQAGISMVEGNNAILFLQAGASKNDYLNIITQTRNYFEGQVVLLYLKYLNRPPTSVEMSTGTSRFESSNDFTIVQRDILSSDEFIGI